MYVVARKFIQLTDMPKATSPLVGLNHAKYIGLTLVDP